MTWAQLLWTGVGLACLGCGTKAVGVDACEEIETARCEAAEKCGEVKDADECSRFARDNCLHGVALDDEPSSVAVTRCVTALNTAGDCARKNGKTSRARDCKGLNAPASEQVCDIVLEPERADRCAFLAPGETDDDDDTSDTEADAGD